ncbi:MAG: hypothetical protein JRG73_16415 [Deltaproteobacteria bacterium]|nr:hypothetical protein [Deltaproteobacteria bacterium]
MATKLWNECPEVEMIRDYKVQATIKNDKIRWSLLGGGHNPVFVSMKPNIETIYNQTLEAIADMA